VKSSKLLVLPRIFLGIIFLAASYTKSVVPVSVQMSGLLNHGGTDPAFAWYRSFTHNVVLPYVGVFGALVVLGEIYVGLALLFGITTRLAAGVAIFLLLNFMCAKEVFPWNPSISDSPDIILCLVVMIGAAGRTWGIDRLLHERYPAVPIW
jgi:thiosulfate dehydrogenase [quinone] large subunit